MAKKNEKKSVKQLKTLPLQQLQHVNGGGTGIPGQYGTGSGGGGTRIND